MDSLSPVPPSPAPPAGPTEATPSPAVVTESPDVTAVGVAAPATTTTGTEVQLIPVKIEEVFPYAKSKCKTCWGKGFFMRILPNGQKAPKECGCAAQRFIKANKDSLIHDKKTGSYFRRVG